MNFNVMNPDAAGLLIGFQQPNVPKNIDEANVCDFQGYVDQSTAKSLRSWHGAGNCLNVPESTETFYIATNFNALNW